MKQSTFENIISWNSTRYDREYNQELTLELLTEEIREFGLAEGPVETLDALCDIFFVSVGAIWKFGRHPYKLMKSASAITAMPFPHVDVPPQHQLLSLMIRNKDQLTLSATHTLRGLTNLAMLSLQGMVTLGLNLKQAEDAILMVCEANNTKSPSTLASHEKYDTNGKGSAWVDPAPLLAELLDSAGVGQ